MIMPFQRILKTFLGKDQSKTKVVVLRGEWSEAQLNAIRLFFSEQ